MDDKKWAKGESEKGFTVSELLLVMALLMLSFGVFFNVFSFGLRQMQNTTQSIQAERDAQQGLAWLTYELREAQAVDSSQAAVLDIANANEVRFYLDTAAAEGPLRVHYFLRGSELIRGTLRPDVPNPPWIYTRQEQEDAVANYIRNNSQSPMFRYFDVNQVEIAPPIDEIGRKNIRIIRISLISDVDTSASPAPFSCGSEVKLRNQK